MNKKQIYFLRKQGISAVEIKKFLKNCVKIFKLSFIFLTLHSFSYANIIYDKNNILITKIELEQFMDLYAANKNFEIANDLALKELILLKKKIAQIEKSQPEYISSIGNLIKSTYGKEIYDNKISRDFFIYLKIREEFILDFFKNEFTEKDISNVLSSFEEFKLQISNNNCKTIIKIIDHNSYENFNKVLFDNLKNKTKSFEINIEGKTYNVCIDQKRLNLIEKKIIEYIEVKTEEDFNKFFYAN